MSKTWTATLGNTQPFTLRVKGSFRGIKSAMVVKANRGSRGTALPIGRGTALRWAGHVARMGDERGTYSVLVGKPEGKRPLGRPRHRWVDNIRMDLQEVGCGYVDWIGLAQDRDRWRTFVSAVMNLRVP